MAPVPTRMWDRGDVPYVLTTYPIVPTLGVMMNRTRINRLVRVYTGAEKSGLTILSAYVRRALLYVAHGDNEQARRRLQDAAYLCDLATHGTPEAQTFAPGAKAVILETLQNFA